MKKNIRITEKASFESGNPVPCILHYEKRQLMVYCVMGEYIPFTCIINLKTNKLAKRFQNQAFNTISLFRFNSDTFSSLGMGGEINTLSLSSYEGETNFTRKGDGFFHVSIIKLNDTEDRFGAISMKHSFRIWSFSQSKLIEVCFLKHIFGDPNIEVGVSSKVVESAKLKHTLYMNLKNKKNKNLSYVYKLNYSTKEGKKIMELNEKNCEIRTIFVLPKKKGNGEFVCCSGNPYILIFYDTKLKGITKKVKFSDLRINKENDVYCSAVFQKMYIFIGDRNGYFSIFKKGVFCKREKIVVKDRASLISMKVLDKKKKKGGKSKCLVAIGSNHPDEKVRILELENILL